MFCDISLVKWSNLPQGFLEFFVWLCVEKKFFVSMIPNRTKTRFTSKKCLFYFIFENLYRFENLNFRGSPMWLFSLLFDIENAFHTLGDWLRKKKFFFRGLHYLKKKFKKRFAGPICPTPCENSAIRLISAWNAQKCKVVQIAPFKGNSDQSTFWEKTGDWKSRNFFPTHHVVLSATQHTRWKVWTHMQKPMRGTWLNLKNGPNCPIWRYIKIIESCSSMKPTFFPCGRFA